MSFVNRSTEPSRPPTTRARGRIKMVLAFLSALFVVSSSPVAGEMAGGPSAGSALPNELVIFGEQLYFVADDGSHGFELWKSDGTAAGTSLVRDITPGEGDSFPWPFAATAEALFFGAGLDPRTLWRTDGTEEGTSQVLPHPATRGRPAFEEFAATDERLFFVADDPAGGAELWTSDGTEAGTRMVADLRAGPDGSHPGRLTAAGDRVFFTVMAGDREVDPDLPEGAMQLWASDGTEVGTVSLGSLAPRGAEPRGLTDVGGTFYFLTRGGRIWTSDGTAAGTRVVARATPDRGGMVIGDGDMEGVGDHLFFVVDAGKKDELWISDGTEAGTQRLKRFKHLDGLRDVGGMLYFVADDGRTGREPWVSDGTKVGTRIVKDVRSGKKGSRPRDFTGAGDTVFFTANDGRHGDEVWATDGTPAGTHLVRDVRPGKPGSRGFGVLWFENVGLAGLGDQVLFPADDGAAGTELWVSDGTETGTRIVADIHPPVE